MPNKALFYLRRFNRSKTDFSPTPLSIEEEERSGKGINVKEDNRRLCSILLNHKRVDLIFIPLTLMPFCDIGIDGKLGLVARFDINPQKRIGTFAIATATITPHI